MGPRRGNADISTGKSNPCRAAKARESDVALRGLRPNPARLPRETPCRPANPSRRILRQRSSPMLRHRLVMLPRLGENSFAGSLGFGRVFARSARPTTRPRRAVPGSVLRQPGSAVGAPRRAPVLRAELPPPRAAGALKRDRGSHVRLPVVSREEVTATRDPAPKSFPFGIEASLRPNPGGCVWNPEVPRTQKKSGRPKPPAGIRFVGAGPIS